MLQLQLDTNLIFAHPHILFRIAKHRDQLIHLQYDELQVICSCTMRRSKLLINLVNNGLIKN
jgi:hypothetical protein